MRAASLAAILDPVGPGSFFAENFETKPLAVLRDDGRCFEDLLSLDEVDNIITTYPLVHPNVRLVRADRAIEASEYCRGDQTIIVDRLLRLHSDGATIILNHLHLHHPQLASLCAAMECQFGASLQTNVYLTPPDAKGFKAHFDTHDVFVLQIAGRKHWTLYQQAIRLPIEGQAEEIEPGQPSLAIELKKGDTLYIPRGLVHDAKSGSLRSLHVTLGLLSYTWADVIVETVANAILSDPQFRRAIPRDLLDTNEADPNARAEFARMMDAVARAGGLESTIATLRMDLIESRRPLLRGQLNMLERLTTLQLESTLTVRSDVRTSLHEDAESVHVRCHGKQISLPLSTADAVRFALSKASFRVRDLPCELDDDSKLVLARRFVREGILRIEEAA